MANIGIRMVVAVCIGVIAGTGAPPLTAQSLIHVAAASAKCQAAKRKVASGVRSLDQTVATIDRYTTASASCASPEVCRRYQTKIKALEDRRARREARVEKLKAGAAAVCGPA
jgi:hypothetical protein